MAHAFLEHPGPIAVAHRGGAAVHPENTMGAFAHAVSLGFRYLETDVHLTADGHVVAFHDDRLDRVSDRQGVIAELSLAEVRRARIGGTGQVVLLDELLIAFPDRRFNIDPKADAVVEPLARVLARHDAVERVCIGSFSDARIARVRALLGAGLCTSGGPRAVARLRLAATGARVRVPHMACVQVPVRARGVTIVDARFVQAAHRRGMQVHVWTVDDPAEMHRLLDLGVDGIMTDRPEVLRDVLLARDAWHHAG
jgi:glycerophosphoryl diester phosphodiesterase